MELVVGQINAMRSIAVAAEIKNLMLNNGCDIMCVQEPYAVRGNVCGYGSQALGLVYPKVEFPWVAMIVRDTVEFFPLSGCGSGHLMVTECSISDFKFYIINLYCQYSLPLEGFLVQLEKCLVKLRAEKILIVMDANAQSGCWYSKRTDDNGKKLEEFIMEYGLTVLNSPSGVTTYASSHGTSNIDLTLCTPNMARYVKSWLVTELISASDHNLILIKIRGDPGLVKSIRPDSVYNLRRADWEKFEDLVDELFSEEYLEVLRAMKTDRMCRSFSKTMEKVCARAIPKRKKVGNSIPWWTETLDVLKRKMRIRKRQLRRARKLNLKELLDKCVLGYKKARNDFVSEIRKCKIASWRNFVSQEGNRDPWGLLHKILREKLRRSLHIGSMVLPGGQMTDSWEESVLALCEKFFPKDNQADESEFHSEIRRMNSEYKNSNIEPDVSEIEIQESIKKTKSGKAPGPDGFPPDCVKRLGRIKIEILIILFNKCLRDGRFPKSWKLARVIVLPKRLDIDLQAISSYRPIALLSVASKLLERVIVNRVQSQYNERGLSSDRQFGFKKGVGTEDALIEFKKEIDCTSKKYVVALFIDIVGAFDNLWWPAIVNRLVVAGCSSELIRIVKSYFSNRKVIIKDLTRNVCYGVERGCPQGSIFGPAAWNWCLDQFLTNFTCNFEAEDVGVIAYADDVAFMIKANSRLELETMGNRATEALHEWCLNNKLKISETKTRALLVKGKLDIKRPPGIKIYGKTVKFVEKHKYLGIIIDAKLTFLPHLKWNREKITKYMMKVKRHAHEEWGIRTPIMNIWYRAVCVPIFTYGSVLWYSRVTTVEALRQIRSMQRTVLMVITRACRTVSTAAMQVVSGTLPVELEIIRTALRRLSKRNMSVEWNGISINRSVQDDDMTVAEKFDIIDNRISEIWQKEWDENSHGRDTYKFIRQVNFTDSRPWFRPSMRVVGIITGYGSIRSSLERRGLENSARCPSCGYENETVEHILFSCPRYTAIRYDAIETANIELEKLIDTKDEYQKFFEFVAKIYELRKEALRQEFT